MRNVKNKLQPAVLNLSCETWNINYKQQYLIYDAKVKNKLQPAVLNLSYETWKINYNQQ